jgi:ferredoxin
VQCKAECIDLRSRRVDFDRCVACFDCIPACPESGIGYRRAARRSRPAAATARDGGTVARGRRRALRLALRGGLLLAGAVALRMPRAREWPVNRNPTRIPVVRARPVAPPGAGSAARFHQACTACQLCVGLCPTQVLQPSLRAYGPGGFLQPHMDFEVAYCTYECTRCGEVCPTDAIRPLALDDKKRARIGEVRFVEDNCIVVTEQTACGACAEHCPTRAVHMVPHEGELTIPALAAELCIGCGACEHACPVRPYRAIYVEGEAEQGVARAPVAEDLDVAVPEDFPF